EIQSSDTPSGRHLSNPTTMKQLILFAAALCSVILPIGAVVRETEYGYVEGTNFTLHTGKAVQAFLGIPFAQPPIGALRYMHPLKYAGPQWPMNQPLNATYPRPSCWGVPLQWVSHQDPIYDDFSEDCLFLNIYAPGDAAEGVTSYPVMFWIHGGGYTGSGSVQYPGHFLAAEGVIVIIIQYRLAQLGFLTTEDENAPGNCGAMDQVMSLQFVHDNIAKFGGDPGKVTLFGQSAGGSSSGLMTLSPLTEGLFHQVIAESGTDMAPWAIVDPDEHPRNYAVQLVEALNRELDYECPTDNNTAMVECLRTVEPYEMLIGGILEVEETLGFITHIWGPRVDGKFLLDRPITLREQGKFHKVPVMTGQTTEDGSMFALIGVPATSDGGLNRTLWYEVINKLIKQLSPPGADYEAATRAIDFEYSNWPHIDDELANRDRIVDMFTDCGFAIGNDLFARSHSEYNATYQYLLGYRSANATEEDLPAWMGVPHNGELPYVLGWPYIGINPMVKYHLAGMQQVLDFNEFDNHMTDIIIKMWTNFAKYGNPTPEPVNNFTWPQFDTTDYNYMSIDRMGDFEVKKEYNPHRTAFWTQYAPWILKGLEVPTEAPTSTPSTAPPVSSSAAPASSSSDATTIVSSTVSASTEPSGGSVAPQTSDELTSEGQNYRIATIVLGVTCGVLLLGLLAALWKRTKVDSELKEQNGNYELNPVKVDP
ncbi:unnamed protein product, partial [Owenia fusiformis]